MRLGSQPTRVNPRCPVVQALDEAADHLPACFEAVPKLPLPYRIANVAAPGQFTQLAWCPAIGGKPWNTPVLVGDVLLVRNSQEMAAFRLSLADG